VVDLLLGALLVLLILTIKILVLAIKILVWKRTENRVIAIYLSPHSLTDDVATVKRAIVMFGEPTILVGHAYGGFVINAAYNNPDLKGLVYVAAPAAMEGQSMSTVLSALPKEFDKENLSSIMKDLRT